MRFAGAIPEADDVAIGVAQRDGESERFGGTECPPKPELKIAWRPVVWLDAPGNLHDVAVLRKVRLDDLCVQTVEKRIAGRQHKRSRTWTKQRIVQGCASRAALADQLVDRCLQLGLAVMAAAGEAIAEVDHQAEV